MKLCVVAAKVSGFINSEQITKDTFQTAIANGPNLEISLKPSTVFDKIPKKIMPFDTNAEATLAQEAINKGAVTFFDRSRHYGVDL